MNATNLGLGYVSSIVHEENDVPKFIVRPCQPSPLHIQRLPHCTHLVGLDLVYAWQTSTQHQTMPKVSTLLLADPFAQRLSLPFLALLDDAVGRFVSWHLVKRYPLAFGSWRRQLDVEVPCFPIIYRCIRAIMNRTLNPAFKNKCHQLFEVMMENVRLSNARASTSLLARLPGNDLTSVLEATDAIPSEIDALCFSMERLFQKSMRAPKFQKGLTHFPTLDRTHDDEHSQSQSHCPPNEGLNYDTLWPKPFELFSPTRILDEMTSLLNSPFPPSDSTIKAPCINDIISRPGMSFHHHQDDLAFDWDGDNEFILDPDKLTSRVGYSISSLHGLDKYPIDHNTFHSQSQSLDRTCLEYGKNGPILVLNDVSHGLGHMLQLPKWSDNTLVEDKELSLDSDAAGKALDVCVDGSGSLMTRTPQYTSMRQVSLGSIESMMTTYKQTSYFEGFMGVENCNPLNNELLLFTKTYGSNQDDDENDLLSVAGSDSTMSVISFGDDKFQHDASHICHISHTPLTLSAACPSLVDQQEHLDGDDPIESDSQATVSQCGDKTTDDPYDSDLDWFEGDELILDVF
ncbi:hypothetical protein AMATHDRAFT_84027 [Amanita thiersii Skay4041]|uniref:Uncharacterized protein n=1 Tax=Amanita thiersii Skay4041 TaxID=703135 RepID=A0A2A9NS86_9AGAR|nr:hypothetical protein AMATHDRAFT_84027 [Amanita thiersii Skay4041]